MIYILKSIARIDQLQSQYHCSREILTVQYSDCIRSKNKGLKKELWVEIYKASKIYAYSNYLN